jgi:hypothetical protein
MTLDVRVLEMLDVLAGQDVASNVKDEQAMDYLNEIDLPKDRPGLRTQYVKYYFKAKQDYKASQSLGKLDIYKQDI